MSKPRTAFGITLEMAACLIFLFIAIVTDDTMVWKLVTFGFVIFQYLREKAKDNHYFFGE